MAIAGRVAIVPKGAWVETETYQKLDLVTHNRNAYIAKKTSIGVVPEDGEFWMLILENYLQTEVDELSAEISDILSGTTQVGNAGKLNGHADTHFATASDVQSIINGTQKVGDSDRLGGELPEHYATAQSVSDILSGTTQVGNANLSNNARTLRTKAADGGYHSAGIWDIEAKYNVKNNGKFYLQALDGDNVKGVSVDDADTVDGYHASDFLPLTGGTLSCNKLPIANGYGHIFSNDTAINIATKVNATDELNMRYFAVINSTLHPNLKDSLFLTDVMNGTGMNYRVFGEHNKPTGTYIGNGSATARQIAVGGVGEMLYVKTGIGYCALVMSDGAIVKSGTTLSALSKEAARYENGVLYLATALDLLNANGDTKIYRVI